MAWVTGLLLDSPLGPVDPPAESDRSSPTTGRTPESRHRFPGGYGCGEMLVDDPANLWTVAPSAVAQSNRTVLDIPVSPQVPSVVQRNQGLARGFVLALPAQSQTAPEPD